MKIYWENQEQANEEGDFVAVLEPEVEKGETGGKQRFKGKSHKEVADQLLEAQAHATKIHQMSKAAEPLEPSTAAAAGEPAPMSADERFEVGAGLQDPTQAPETVAKIMERELGKPLAEVRKILGKEDLAARQAEILRVSKEFMDETPEFLPCKHNEELMYGYLDARNAAISKKNLSIAFERLKEAGLLVFRPENAVEVEEEPAAEVVETPAAVATEPAATATTAPGQAPGGLPAKTAVTVRERTTSSSGIRLQDVSGNRPAKGAPKYTWAQVEAMPKEQYKNLLDSDPEFKAFVLSGQKAAAVR
jgi:hypothetical protein